MSIWHIYGGNRLTGSTRVQGAKNAVLPIMAASVLSGGETVLHNVPDLRDVTTTLRILQHLGCTAVRDGDTVRIDSRRDALRFHPARTHAGAALVGYLSRRDPRTLRHGAPVHAGRVRARGRGPGEPGTWTRCARSARRSRSAAATSSAGRTRFRGGASCCRFRASAQRKTPCSPPAQRRGRRLSAMPRASRRSPTCSATCASSARTFPARARPRSRSAASGRGRLSSTRSCPTASSQRRSCALPPPAAARWSCRM